MPDPVVTRLRSLVEKIKPLADWMTANRPDVKTIAIFKKDWIFLIKAPTAALRAHGFDVTAEKGLTYGSYKLRPVVQEVKKE